MLAGQVLAEVDHVGADVTQGTGASALFAHPPCQGYVRVHEPVLEVGASHVAQVTQAPVSHELSGQLYGGSAPIVEADHRTLPRRPCFLGHQGHCLGLGDGVGQGFLAQYVLAVFQRVDGDRHMAVAGRADVDDVDVVARYDFTPVRGGLGKPVPLGGHFDARTVASAEHC